MSESNRKLKRNSGNKTKQNVYAQGGNDHLFKTCIIEIPAGESVSLRRPSPHNIPYETYAPVCSPAPSLLDESLRYSFCQSNLSPFDACNNLVSHRKDENIISKYFAMVPNYHTEHLIITNLPCGTPQKDVFQLCSKVKPKKVNLNKTSGSQSLYAHVVVGNSEACDVFIKDANNKKYLGNKLNIIRVNKMFA